MTRSELDRVFNNTEMKKRTKQFAILGMSLSNLLDIHQPQDLLRGLLNTLTEYEQSKEEGDKPKKVRLAGPDFEAETVSNAHGMSSGCSKQE